MEFLNKIKSYLGIESNPNEFYQNCKIEKVEWWLAWCSFYPELYWARLRTFSNGKADLLFQAENKAYGFENKEYAEYFLSEDEFTSFENLDDEDKKDLEIPSNVFIEIPNWANKEVGNFEYIGKY